MSNHVRRTAGLIAGLILITVAPGLSRDEPGDVTTGREPSAFPRPLGLPGIENGYRLSPRLLSGGEPRGAGAFAALQALGVRTILSVDASRPDPQTARRFGIRYVHLPVGYDGIPRERAVQIVEAARTLPGPVVIHCH